MSLTNYQTWPLSLVRYTLGLLKVVMFKLFDGHPSFLLFFIMVQRNTAFGFPNILWVLCKKFPVFGSGCVQLNSTHPSRHCFHWNSNLNSYKLHFKEISAKLIKGALWNHFKFFMSDEFHHWYYLHFSYNLCVGHKLYTDLWHTVGFQHKCCDWIIDHPLTFNNDEEWDFTTMMVWRHFFRMVLSVITEWSNTPGVLFLFYYYNEWLNEWNFYYCVMHTIVYPALVGL